MGYSDSAIMTLLDTHTIEENSFQDEKVVKVIR